MKINGINRPQVDAAIAARPVAQRAVGSSATKVAVSSEARQLADARAPAASDAAKVQRLSLAVASGDFSVDAERVSERMLAEER